MFSQRSKYIVLLGFIGVVLLMIIVLIMGLSHNADGHARLERTIKEDGLKTELITKMYVSARDRTVSLLSMLGTTDIFERDEAFLQFDLLAGQYVEARDQFLAMSLNDTERKDMEQLAFLADVSRQLIAPVREKFLNESLMGQDEASRGLLDEVIPAQNQLLDHLKAMLVHQEELSEEYFKAAEAEYDTQRAQLILLSAASVSLALYIAWYVYRRASDARDALYANVTLQAIGDAVITTDDHGNINFMNSVAEHLTGHLFDSVRRQPLDSAFRMINGHGEAVLWRPALRALCDGDFLEDSACHYADDTMLITRCGAEVAVDVSCSPIRDQYRNIIGVVIAFRDVSEARALRDQLTYQASHDALTGLYNRVEFEARVYRALVQAQDNGVEHALLYMDLDKFKVVNDSCGHIAGDSLLSQLSDIFASQLRGSDSLARLGGDEFGVLLERCTAEQAMRAAKALLKAVQEFRFAWEGRSYAVGVSIGVAAINACSESLESVLSAADSACYDAKEAGRNRIRVYCEDDQANANRQGEMQWLSVINRALEEDQFELHFQDIAPVNATYHPGEYFEILLRLRGEDGKMVAPGFFIPAAERYGMAARVDEWVVENTLKWLSQHPQVMARLQRCSINLSGQTMGDEAFLNFAMEVFDRYSIDPKQICFEITETVAIANMSNAQTLISELGETGCRFSLDDFGSGLSSFGYLKNLPVDYLKIDGLFVKDMAEDPISYAMVKSINEIGHVMQKQTIAEYVEDATIMEKLQEIGIDYAQGWHISKPRPMDELAKLCDDVVCALPVPTTL